MTYLAQSFSKGNLLVCSHKFRACDCGAVHCISKCKFWQKPFGEWRMPLKDGTFATYTEPTPEKRAPCGFHGGELV